MKFTKDYRYLFCYPSVWIDIILMPIRIRLSIFHANPDPDSDPDTQRFTHVEKRVFTFIHSRASLHCFFFLVSIIVS
jgi:hypothetical protein